MKSTIKKLEVKIDVKNHFISMKLTIRHKVFIVLISIKSKTKTLKYVKYALHTKKKY